MQLDNSICYKAIRSRDKRFDGRFFTAVTSTGIFCRPVCPAVTPKVDNCRFLPSAAAALEQGFRPCLRCRPESAPGSPAWNGVSTTVSRAMKLIQAGALNDSDIHAFSERLGVTARHLRRLFQEHLGASPTAVAHAQRLMFAVRLITETDLPMGQIAISAGFGSVRRFNDTIRQLYKKSPRELRRSLPVAAGNSGNVIRLRLDYQPPYDWQRLLKFFQSRAIPGVESVSDTFYRRSIRTGSASGMLEVSIDESAGKLLIGFDVDDSVDLQTSVWKVRRIFDLDTDRDAINRLLANDDVLGTLVKARPGLCVPGAWDVFELAVRAILGQQISVQAACTLAGRLVERFGEPLAGFSDKGIGHLFPTPQYLVGQDVSVIGLPKKRAASITALAETFANNSTGLDRAQDLESIQAALCKLQGIGPWTAQYIAMRAFGEPDAFPTGDLGLLRSLEALGFNTDIRGMQNMADNWRPFRAYATLHLWSALADKKG